MCLVTAGLISSTSSDSSSCGQSSYTVAGINQFYITNSEWISQYYFDTSDTLLSTITSLSLDPAFEAFEYQVEKVNDAYSEVENISESGYEYIKTLDVTFYKMTPEKRDRLLELMRTKTKIFFQDRNSYWHMMGEDNPCKVVSYKATTDNSEGKNLLNVVFESRGKYPGRYIDADYVCVHVTELCVETTPQDCDCITLETQVLANSATCLLNDLASCSLN